MHISNLKTKSKLNLCVFIMLFGFLLEAGYMLYQIQRIASAGEAMSYANASETYFSRARIAFREFTNSFNEAHFKLGKSNVDSMLLCLDKLEAIVSATGDAAERSHALRENISKYIQGAEELSGLARDITQAVDKTQKAIDYYMSFVIGDTSLSSELLMQSFLTAREGIIGLERRNLASLDRALAHIAAIEKKPIGRLYEPLQAYKKDLLLVRSKGELVLDNIANAQIESVQMSGHFEEMVNYFIEVHHESERKAVSISVILLVIVLLISIIGSQLVGNYIVKQLQHTLSLLQHCSRGDFTFKIDMDQKIYNDEFGALTIALDVMIEKIRDTIHEIQTGAANVADASAQLSDASQRISQGTNDQSASTEEVSSAMEEMYANIDQNSDGAMEAKSLARMMEQHISDLSTRMSDSMTSVQTIHEKISIVSEIARQTNILALNAAVEAARAGEHGKGFSVVASEVRKLAERSRDAAKEISDLSIHSLTTTETAVENLQNVLPDVHKTAHLVEEIATASTEQKSGVDQINVAIQSLNDVVQSNAASSEELATSAEELNAQADILRDATRFFKI